MKGNQPMGGQDDGSSKMPILHVSKISLFGDHKGRVSVTRQRFQWTLRGKNCKSPKTKDTAKEIAGLATVRVLEASGRVSEGPLLEAVWISEAPEVLGARTLPGAPGLTTRNKMEQDPGVTCWGGVYSHPVSGCSGHP